MKKMVWVYWKGALTYVVEEFNCIDELADMYPEAIYFYAGVELVPLEED